MNSNHSTLFAILLLLLGIAEAYAQTPFEVKKSQASEIEYYTSNYGIFGLNVQSGESGFFYPPGSGKQYRFSSGLWFGAQKLVQRDGEPIAEEESLTFIGYNPNTGTSWGTPGEYDRTSAATPILYRSSDYDRLTGISGGDPTNDPKWPLWLLPGERTSPFFGGHFVPLNGDRTDEGIYDQPAFMNGVDEEFFARYHDRDLSRYEISSEQARDLGYPLGLQVQERVYSWSPGSGMQNVIIFQYEVVNVSQDELMNCYIAQAIDFDIGYPANDRQTFYYPRPDLKTAVAWSEPEASGSNKHGMLAMVLLEGPMTGDDFSVDNGLRREFASAEEAGTFCNWEAKYYDPQTPEERYSFMASRFRDGDTGPGDKRALIGSNVFQMEPGDTAHLAVALAVLDGLEFSSSELPELEALVEKLHTRYYVTGFGGETSSGNTDNQRQGSSLSAALSPNPGTDNTTISLTLAHRSDLRIRVIDNVGRVVYTGNVESAPAGQSLYRLNLEGVDAGSYLLSIEAGTEEQSIRFNVLR